MICFANMQVAQFVSVKDAKSETSSRRTNCYNYIKASERKYREWQPVTQFPLLIHTAGPMMRQTAPCIEATTFSL